jgi:protein ImuB
VGPEVVAFIDRALGRIPDPRAPYRAPERYARRSRLPAATGEVEALLFASQRLVAELSGMLAGKGAGVLGLEVELYHCPRGSTRVRIELLSPTRDASHLMLLLKERLLRTPLSRPVEVVELTAEAFVAVDAQEPDLFARPGETIEAWERLVERLSMRLGRTAVKRIRRVAEHRPERAWSHEPSCRLPEIPARSDGGSRPRPCWLLAKPIALASERGGPAFHGSLQVESRAERIESGWWDGQDVARDYFVAVNENGERYWIFRERRAPESWYLHGIFA